MFRRNTVDGILSSITKSLSRLERVAQQQREAADAAEARRFRALVDMNEADEERVRALRVHAKLSQLVS